MGDELDSGLNSFVKAIPDKWAKRFLVLALSVLGATTVVLYTVGASAWSEVKQDVRNVKDKTAAHDVDIAKLATATENLRLTVESQSQDAAKRAEKSDERARRMDRLLDFLERSSYPKSLKEEGK